MRKAQIIPIVICILSFIVIAIGVTSLMTDGILADFIYFPTNFIMVLGGIEGLIAAFITEMLILVVKVNFDD